MPYSSVSELPPAVRRKIKSPKKRRQWMHVWNSEYERHGDESRAFAGAWATVQKAPRIDKASASYTPHPVGGERCSQCTMFRDPDSCTLVRGSISPSSHCKFYEAKTMTKAVGSDGAFNFFLPLTKIEKNKDGSVTVAGYASTPALDLDGEIVSLDAVKAALPGYWEWRNIREMHQPRAVGVGQEANVDQKGLFLTAKITDRDAAQKCLDQVYKGYSIGGRKLSKTGNMITEIDLIEISLVDRPANPECRIEVAKRAKADSAAHLMKMKVPRSPQTRALSKMAQVVEMLTKEGPPAAHDGFSLPAKTVCKAHGLVDCAKCAGLGNVPTGGKTAKVKKRDVSRKERKRLAQTGAALPDGSFPIANRSDLANARQAIGRAKDPSKARAHIVSRARDLGVTLPDNWKKKAARALIAKAAESAEFLTLEPSLLSRRLPSFLTLGADLEGGTDFGHGSEPGLQLGSREDGTSDFLQFGKTSKRKGLEMTDSNLDALTDAIVKVMKKGRTSPTARIIGQARGNLKKARKAAGDMEDGIRKAHGMLKSAYLAKQAMIKAGKKPADDGDADDADLMGKVMGELNKAFGSSQTMKTFIKAANGQLKKAAGRSGQRGQEVSDGDGGFYTVPPGVKDRSISELVSAAPGNEGSGSQPPMYPGDGSVYPGKAARKAGLISKSEAEALARAAAAEAQVDILSKMPAATGRRTPYAFDVNKALGGGSSASDSVSDLLEGVDTRAIGSGDESAHTQATGRMLGNMILKGHGRSVLFDPEFKGAAAGKSN